MFASFFPMMMKKEEKEKAEEETPEKEKMDDYSTDESSMPTLPSAVYVQPAGSTSSCSASSVSSSSSSSSSASSSYTSCVSGESHDAPVVYMDNGSNNSSDGTMFTAANTLNDTSPTKEHQMSQQQQWQQQWKQLRQEHQQQVQVQVQPQKQKQKHQPPRPQHRQWKLDPQRPVYSERRTKRYHRTYDFVQYGEYVEEGSIGVPTVHSGRTETTGTQSSLEDESFDVDSDIDHDNDDDNDNDNDTTRQEEDNAPTQKLTLKLDEVRNLARMGQPAALRQTYSLPNHIKKSDIFVSVDIDYGSASASMKRRLNQVQLEEQIKDAIRDDLQAVYSATNKESAKLILCIVVVLVTDGSLTRSIMDSDGVAGLAEIGLVWRLFEPDGLKVYNGGLEVQSEDFGYHLAELFVNRGQQCLFDKLVPRVANSIMSRIGESNTTMLVEI